VFSFSPEYALLKSSLHPSLGIPRETSTRHNWRNFLAHKPSLEPRKGNGHSKWTICQTGSSKGFSPENYKTSLFCYFPRLGTQLHFAINASRIYPAETYYYAF
jgi:hypothetical protein